VLRGGSWSSTAEYCRSAYRGRGAPDYRINFIGFRPVRLAKIAEGDPPTPEASARQSRSAALQERDFDWRLYNLRGDLLTMDVFRGKVIFLNFWATWCPPCVAELPEIAGAYEKHGDHVVFLLVTSEEPEKVTAFLKKRGYDLPVYFTAGPAPRTLDATALPTTFIISKEGKIVSRKTGAANWDSGATTRIFDRLTR
jgi:thiol-disulfide isomerase/thioredoxin